MSKRRRQETVLELIERNEIGTQEELAEYLEKEGFFVTQATVSRDIRELGLKKRSGRKGTQKYYAPSGYKGAPDDKYVRVLREGLLSMDHAQNILVVKTVSGMAMAVAAALDAMALKEIVGCIAGDDTVMAAVRTLADTETVMDEIRRLCG